MQTERKEEKDKMKKKTVLALVLVLALSLSLFAGCSSSSDDAQGDTATDDTAKVYTIATDTTFMPFEFQDDNGNYVGVDVDLLAAIAEDQGFEYELQPLGFDAACAALESDQVDGVIAGMSITDVRKEKYDFSDAYFDSGVCVAVKSDSEVASLDDLKGQIVAVKTGTEGATYAESIKDEYELELKYFEESPLMYQEVLTGNAVACVEDYPVMGYSIATGNVDLKMVGEKVQGSSYGFAVKKGENAELLSMFNAGLANLKASGKYDEIISTYIQGE